MSVYVFLNGNREDPIVFEEGAGWVFDSSGQTLVIEDEEYNPIAEFPEENVFYVSTIKEDKVSRLPGTVKDE